MTRRDTLRVAVDVTPRLLRDTLTRVLAEHDIEVVVLPDDEPGRASARCDVVVTSAGAPIRVSGATHVEVAANTGDVRTVRRPHTTNGGPARVQNLDDLLAVLQRFVGADDEKTPPTGPRGA